MASAEVAQRLGMIDGIETMNETLARLNGGVLPKTITAPEPPMNDQRPLPRLPLRRARLTPDGHTITVTPEGYVVDGLELEILPTRAEAGRIIAARQWPHILAGMAPREALDAALKEVHPAYRRAYIGNIALDPSQVATPHDG